MKDLLQDLRYGLRTLKNTPAFTTVAVLTLALGIGSNTAIFSVMNSLYFHPSGILDPDRLLAVRVSYEKLNLPSIEVSLPDFVDVRDAKQIFSAAAVMALADYNFVGRGGPERLMGAQVSPQWFQTFGARPLLGRDFRPEEDQPFANQVAILSYGTWEKRFGGDRDIVGKTIQLNSKSYQVVGVMPADFNWPTETQLWVPLGLPASSYAPDNRFNENYFAIARLRAGVSRKQGEAFLALKSAQLPQPQAQTYARDSGWSMFALPFIELVYGDLRTPMLVLLAAVGLVLLIACANIAGLMLAKASGRARELAIRAALGASPWLLIRQTLVESLLLSLAGSLLGLAVTTSAVRAIQLLVPEETIRTLSVPVDASVLLFTLSMVVLSALLFGVAPAWQMSRQSDVETLKEGGRLGTAGCSRLRLRSALVIAEVSMALVLLVGSGLLLKSLVRLQHVNPGFDARGVMTASVSLSPTAYNDDSKQEEFYRAVTERLASQPGVVSAAAASPLPFSGQASAASFEIEGRAIAPGDPGPHSNEATVTPEYFSTLQIPLRRGRVFTDRDRMNTQLVVVIDDTLADQYWPNQDPIGQHLRRGRNSPWSTVIGVASHVHQSALLGEPGKGIRYYSLLQQPLPNATLIGRTSLDPLSLVSPFHEAVKAVDSSGAVVYDFLSMNELVAASLGPPRFAVALLATFALAALLMAALGLYGIISYSVSERTQEIGIRMALGAESWEVLGMVVRQGFQLVAIGVSIGTLGAFALARLIYSQLFAVNVFDPATLFLVVVLMGGVTLFASYFPARRAAHVDPMVALRYQ